MKVKKVMTRNVITVKPTDYISDAIEKMKRHKISGLPVVDDSGKLVGILTDGDIIRALDIPDFPREIFSPPPFDFIEAMIRMKMEEWDIERALETWKKGRVEDVMTKDVITVSEDADIESAADIMLEKGIHRLPVVDEKGKLVGIVTRLDLVKALV